MAFRIVFFLLLHQVSLRKGCAGVKEEVKGGNLRASPPQAPLGKSKMPRCYLTISLLVNPRGDATGSRARVSPSRAEVTCWEQLPVPPAGLSGSFRLPGFPFNPPPESPPGFSHLSPPPADFQLCTTIAQSTALHYSHASLLTPSLFLS